MRGEIYVVTFKAKISVPLWCTRAMRFFRKIYSTSKLTYGFIIGGMRLCGEVKADTQ